MNAKKASGMRSTIAFMSCKKLLNEWNQPENERPNETKISYERFILRVVAVIYLFIFLGCAWMCVSVQLWSSVGIQQTEYRMAKSTTIDSRHSSHFYLFGFHSIFWHAIAFQLYYLVWPGLGPLAKIPSSCDHEFDTIFSAQFWSKQKFIALQRCLDVELISSE